MSIETDEKTREALSHEDFLHMATRLDVDPDVLEDLYPLARDLLSFARQLNLLAAELGQEISEDALKGRDPR
ncbi:MAG: hypothetical protein AAFX92_13910 [Pseudomonadota bacterium]